MNDENKTKLQLIKELQELRKEKEFVQAMYHRNIKGADQATKLLHDIIEKNPMSIQIVDKEGLTIKANLAHSLLFQAKPKVNFSIFKDPQLLLQGLEEYFERLKKGEVVNFPDTIYNAGDLDTTFPDNPVNIKVLGFPIFDAEGNPEHFVIMHEDITERKRLQNEKEEKNRQLQHLNEYLQTVREDERKHLADEIHDKFSTSLSIITRRMKNIRDNIVDEESVKEIDAILFITEDARNFVRKMISEIGSDIVRDLGIVSAVKNYTQVFSKNNNIKVNLLLENDLQLNPDVANVIYRIMQESLNNIACHAQADNVSINLRKTNDKLVCCIADNGIGISQQAIDSNETYGLLSMKQRTKNLGGTFLIRGKKRSGTTIDISIPLTSKIIL